MIPEEVSGFNKIMVKGVLPAVEDFPRGLCWRRVSSSDSEMD